jgi:OOP family OmpA-OmpF porin
MKRAAKRVSALGLFGCAVMYCHAAVADGPGWYGGFNVGQSESTIDNQRISGGLLEDGLSTTSIHDDERDIGFKLFGGYQINRYFALEGGYFNLGKFDFKATTIPIGTLNGDIRLQGLNFDAVGILPITEKFSIFGRAGVDYAQARDTFRGSGAVTVINPNPRKSDSNFKFGGGLQYALTRALGMRVEAERYRVSDAVGNKGDIDLFSVGLVYRFGAEGRAPSTVAVAEPAPPPPAVAAPPAPPPPPPPPRPVSRKFTFSADALFDFNKDIVKPAGQRALDEFAVKLVGTRFDVITVSGHTDRLGPAAYNQQLSTRRAEAVKAYLVRSAAVPAEKIQARGMDGSNPVTAPGDCKGNRETRELIACLQPDRRVEIEVTVTQ